MKRIKITEKNAGILRLGVLYAVLLISWVEIPAREIRVWNRNPETGRILAALVNSASRASELMQAPTCHFHKDYSLTSVKPSIDAMGEWFLTRADNMAGTATVTVSLSDNCGSVNGGWIGVVQVIITLVNVLNDLPSFTKQNGCIAE